MLYQNNIEPWPPNRGTYRTVPSVYRATPSIHTETSRQPVKIKVRFLHFFHGFSEAKWHTTKYGDPYSEFVLCIWPIQSVHTQQWTHTHREHTPGAAIYAVAVGGSVPCSRAPQSWYWGWRECCTFPPPTYNPCRTRDSNSQPFDYESDSLTIRPRLPHRLP